MGGRLSRCSEGCLMLEVECSPGMLSSRILSGLKSQRLNSTYRLPPFPSNVAGTTLGYATCSRRSASRTADCPLACVVHAGGQDLRNMLKDCPLFHLVSGATRVGTARDSIGAVAGKCFDYTNRCSRHCRVARWHLQAANA